jgi:hypothetical protein
MSSDRDRERWRRQRASRGCRVISIEVSCEVEDILMRAGTLVEWKPDMIGLRWDERST